MLRTGHGFILLLGGFLEQDISFPLSDIYFFGAKIVGKQLTVLDAYCVSIDIPELFPIVSHVIFSQS